MRVGILAQTADVFRQIHTHGLDLVVEAVCRNRNFNGLSPQKLCDLFGQGDVVLQSNVKVLSLVYKHLGDFPLQIVPVLIYEREPEDSPLLSHFRWCCLQSLTPWEGLEPPTFALGKRGSILLSYQGLKGREAPTQRLTMNAHREIVHSGDDRATGGDTGLFNVAINHVVTSHDNHRSQNESCKLAGLEEGRGAHRYLSTVISLP